MREREGRRELGKKEGGGGEGGRERKRQIDWQTDRQTDRDRGLGGSSGVKAKEPILFPSRRELYRHGVKVIGIQPGGYDTGILSEEQTRRSLEKTYQAASPDVQRVYGSIYVDRGQ